MSAFSAGSVFAFRELFRCSLTFSTAVVTRAGVAIAAEPSDTPVVREALGMTLPLRMVSSVIAGTPLDRWLSRR
jgi:hypothetical protein